MEEQHKDQNENIMQHPLARFMREEDGHLKVQRSFQRAVDYASTEANRTILLRDKVNACFIHYAPFHDRKCKKEVLEYLKSIERKVGYYPAVEDPPQKKHIFN